MNDYILIFVVFTTLLFLYERYLHFSAASSLIIRDRMIHLIKEHENDKNIRPEIIDLAKKATVVIFRKNLIPVMFKGFVMKKNEHNQHEIDMNEDEKKFRIKFFTEAIKANMIGHLFSYAFSLSVLLIVGFIVVFFLLITGELRKIAHFIDKGIENIFFGENIRPSF